MTSRWSCWRFEIFFWGLNSIFMQITPFVSLCKYGFWLHERTHSIVVVTFVFMVVSKFSVNYYNNKSGLLGENVDKRYIFLGIVAFKLNIPSLANIVKCICCSISIKLYWINIASVIVFIIKAGLCFHSC